MPFSNEITWEEFEALVQANDGYAGWALRMWSMCGLGGTYCTPIRRINFDSGFAHFRFEQVAVFRPGATEPEMFDNEGPCYLSAPVVRLYRREDGEVCVSVLDFPHPVITIYPNPQGLDARQLAEDLRARAAD